MHRCQCVKVGKKQRGWGWLESRLVKERRAKGEAVKLDVPVESALLNQHFRFSPDCTEGGYASSGTARRYRRLNRALSPVRHLFKKKCTNCFPVAEYGRPKAPSVYKNIWPVGRCSCLR